MIATAAAGACRITDVSKVAQTASLPERSYLIFFLTGFFFGVALAGRGLCSDFLRLAILFLVPFVAAGRRAVFFLPLAGGL